MISIQQLQQSNIHDIVPLFDAYRIFYGQKSDTDACLKFLNERMSKDESIIFAAYENDVAVGFTQLYFTFSSVSLAPSLVLNDLYVSKDHRKKSIGRDLLLKAQAYCTKYYYKGLALETGIKNPAQKLYEKLGWKKDLYCFHYFWSAKN